MNEKDTFGLVRISATRIEINATGATRVLSGMVAETLDLAEGNKVAISDEQLENWFQTGRKYYANGSGSDQDFVQAVKWYRKAAERNHAGAQYNLGICFYYGAGAPKDLFEAAKWFHKAARQAEQGNAIAQHDLGYRYSKGIGFTKDKVEAAKWYRKAALQGHAEAQCALGVCYAGGVIGTNLVEAAKWLNLSLAQGFQQSKPILTILAKEMTRQQLVEAQRLSDEFHALRTI